MATVHPRFEGGPLSNQRVRMHTLPNVLTITIECELGFIEKAVYFLGKYDNGDYKYDYEGGANGSPA